ncbi:death domain-containing protein CRADD-like, partial [Scleropages formosus]
DVLRKSRLYLSSEILVDDTIVPYLYQEGVLTESQVEEIQSQVTNRKKNLKLLDILPTRGPRAFGAFLRSLEEEFSWVKEKLEQDARGLEDKDAAAAAEAGEDEEHALARECGLSQLALEKVPTDQELNRLVHRLGPDWEWIVVDLGVPVWEVQRCRAEYPLSPHGQALASLVRWRQRSGRRATVRRLLRSLQAADVHPSVLEDVFH